MVIVPKKRPKRLLLLCVMVLDEPASTSDGAAYEMTMAIAHAECSRDAGPAAGAALSCTRLRWAWLLRQVLGQSYSNSSRQRTSAPRLPRAELEMSFTLS